MTDGNGVARAVATCASCASCAHYDKGVCTGHAEPTPVMASDPACSRYLAVDGSGPAPDGAPPARRRTPPEAYRGDTQEAVRQLAAQGMSAPRIAEALGKSRQLVNYHLRTIRQRAQTTRDGRRVLMRLAAPVDARRLARVLDTAVEAWGEVEVEPGPGEIVVVQQQAASPRKRTGEQAA